jgi:hypothetical protein
MGNLFLNVTRIQALCDPLLSSDMLYIYFAFEYTPNAIPNRTTLATLTASRGLSQVTIQRNMP